MKRFGVGSRINSQAYNCLTLSPILCMEKVLYCLGCSWNWMLVWGACRQHPEAPGPLTDPSSRLGSDSFPPLFPFVHRFSDCFCFSVRDIHSPCFVHLRKVIFRTLENYHAKHWGSIRALVGQFRGPWRKDPWEYSERTPFVHPMWKPSRNPVGARLPHHCTNL